MPILSDLVFLPSSFQLPESALPAVFESRSCNRPLLRYTVITPYASLHRPEKLEGKMPILSDLVFLPSSFQLPESALPAVFESRSCNPIRVLLRGKAHAEWKVVVSGDRRTVKDDHVFIDDRVVIWGK
ncbi:hypothetical protein TNIN_477041, partial [Trichonephila inaurata madagascariensis]